VLRPKERYTAAQKAQVLRAYRERMSLRGLQRVFGVWRSTVLRWLRVWVAQLPSLEDTLLPAEAGDVLEMDEVVSFVGEKFFQRWLWTAQCRRTRQIVAYAIGDHSEDTGSVMWQAVPPAYRTCPCYTDGWSAYTVFLPPDQHIPSSKATGFTAHQERWYNTLRQWLGRYTRKSLSFSKQDTYMELVTRWFILEHNLRIRSSLTL
jgi:insertion element IS1 protein InsB